MILLILFYPASANTVQGDAMTNSMYQLSELRGQGWSMRVALGEMSVESGDLADDSPQCERAESSPLKA